MESVAGHRKSKVELVLGGGGVDAGSSRGERLAALDRRRDEATVRRRAVEVGATDCVGAVGPVDVGAVYRDPERTARLRYEDRDRPRAVEVGASDRVSAWLGPVDVRVGARGRARDAARRAARLGRRGAGDRHREPVAPTRVPMFQLAPYDLTWLASHLAMKGERTPGVYGCQSEAAGAAIAQSRACRSACRGRSASAAR
jgi:hypothetical protein